MDIQDINTRKTKLRTALQAVRKLYHDSIAEQIVAEPTTTYGEIARQHGVSKQWVMEVARRRNITRNRYKDEEGEVTHG